LDITSDKICKIKADTLVPLELIFEKWPMIKHITIGLPETINESLLQELKAQLKPGNVPLQLSFAENDKQLILETKEKVAVSTDLLTALAVHPVAIKVAL
jgi:hypothetical protein